MARGTVANVRNEVLATWKEALKEFLFWKQAQGLSERTIEDYKTHVTILFTRFPKAFNPKNLKIGVLEHMSQPVKPATFNLRLVYLRTSLDWCISQGIYHGNPLTGFKRRKVESRMVNLERDTLTQLITSPDKNTFAGLRDYALLLLTLDTGIRPKEALSLRLDDINLHSLEVLIRSEVSKTRTSRTLPISPITGNTIRDLIQARHSMWKNKVPVFCSTEGNQLKVLS